MASHDLAHRADLPGAEAMLPGVVTRCLEQHVAKNLGHRLAPP
jgi:hypothetical protein